VAETGFGRKGLEHRRIRFLELEEQRIVVLVAHEQEHHRLGAHGAHADHLAREVHEPVARQQLAPVGLQRRAVLRKGLGELLGDLLGLGISHDQGRLELDSPGPVDLLGEARERPEVRVRACLVDCLLCQLQPLLVYFLSYEL
jgi:hypothetical protein